MDVENGTNGTHASPINNVDSGHVNGMNGYSDKHKSHKSEHKSKHRDRDRDKERKKEHKSLKDKDRHHHSSSKDKEKDKERHHSSSHKSSSRDKDKEKDKERHRDKDRHREKDEKKSSRDKDKEHKSSRSDKERSDRDKEKEHKSSSRDKDKERKDRDRKDRDKDRHRDKDKHSSSKDKHGDREKDKHSSSRDKDRKDRKDRHKEETKPKVEIKVEMEEDSADDDKLVIQESDDVNNASQASSCNYNMSQFSQNESGFNSDANEDMESQEDEDDDYKMKIEPEVHFKQEVKDEPMEEDEESEEDIPLASRLSASMKRKVESEDEDDDEDELPLSARKKPKKEKSKKKKIKEEKKIKKEKSSVKEESSSPTKGGRKKKEGETQEVWKWWEEEKKSDGTKWHFLEHKGPVFAPPYEPLPSKVKFFYDGEEFRLSEPAEEVAGFYARMLDHDYTTKKVFNENFFRDWRKVMNDEEKATITELKKCNFKHMHAYFMDQAEKNRNKTKEEKLALKEKNEALLKEYGFCTIDGHKEKIGNFKIEPPGLFRGRGEHPKMGMLKKRVEAEHIIINCSKDSEIPKPPKGHRWKEVRHDNSVTWLASWTENVQNQVKYIMLNPSSKLKGEKDMQKYETARKLHRCVDKIRKEYKDDWKSKEMKIRQRAVALYFIDKLALRAGNEKDEDQADTVGCCSLRVEHIQLLEEKDDKEYVVVFDFPGKDSIRYYNEVPVEKRVFKNLQLFMENKSPGDDLFDRLNTTIMNKHLNDLMEGLTAKVFRTYNASWTLQQQLDLLTQEDDTVAEKILTYNRANRAVAILCNHQRAVPKGHEKSMEKLKEKIDAKRDQIKDATRQVKDAEKDAKRGSVKEKTIYDKKKKTLQRLKEQLAKLEIQETDRDENKTIALSTSKLNYLDPRISVAWCKKYDVPIEKIYNKTQRDKFRWAIDMAGPDYRF